jgi:apolipoprotein D and lipocalin family protein
MKFNAKKYLLLLFALIGCKSYPDLPVVSHVDLKSYTGKWYEIAAFPQSFEKDCYCTTAEYNIKEDYIEVINTCRKNGIEGKINQARGKAFVQNNPSNAKLSVQFFWPFRGDYWIIELADDYSYSVVGDPSREYLWILARTPKMSDETYNMLLEKIKTKGFEINKLKRTVQECGN